jgi:hypothetical protein
MPPKTKKEIQKVTEDVLIAALAYLKIEPSKQITKRIIKISKDFSGLLKKEMKQENKSPKAKTGKKKLKSTKLKSKGKPK